MITANPQSKRRRKNTAAERANPTTTDIIHQPSRREIFAWWALAFSLCGSAWLVDPLADASFDAPKQFCVLLGAILASAAFAWHLRPLLWRTWTRAAKWIVALGLIGVACVWIATIASPHPALAWPTLRRWMMMGLFVVIGASSLLDGAAGRRMFGVFLLACALNVLISLAQAAGLELPLHATQIGGRFDTGALLGNEGYVALAAAIMAAACAAIAIGAVSSQQRAVLILLGALAVLVIVINQQKTSAIGLTVALTVIAALRWHARWLLASIAGLLMAMTLTALVPPLRAITWGALPVGGIQGYQRITTYRLGAWIAAMDMATERPLTGYGLGTFGAEAQTHRLAAELRLHDRLVPPTASSFVYAHQEYLQLAAEAGIPALLFFLSAIILLLAKLALLSISASTTEQRVLLAILSTGFITALAWFPLQIPFTACVLLLSAGRALRLIAMSQERT